MLSKLALLQSTAVLVAWLIVVLLYPPLSSLLGAYAGALVYVPVMAAANWDAKLSALAYVLGIVLVVVIHGVPVELFEPEFLMHLGFALVLSVILARLCTEARTRAQQQVKLELLTGRLAYHEQHDPLTGVLNRAASSAPTKLTAFASST